MHAVFFVTEDGFNMSVLYIHQIYQSGDAYGENLKLFPVSVIFILPIVQPSEIVAK
jgi:hypothetical protein